MPLVRPNNARLLQTLRLSKVSETGHLKLVKERYREETCTWVCVWG